MEGVSGVSGGVWTVYWCGVVWCGAPVAPSVGGGGGRARSRICFAKISRHSLIHCTIAIALVRFLPDILTHMHTFSHAHMSMVVIRIGP